MTWRITPLLLLVVLGVGIGCSGKSKGGFFGTSLGPLSMTISPSTGVPADGATTASISLVLRDKTTGAPIKGGSITIVASGTGNIITQPGPTDANGKTEGRIASTVAEQKVITATSTTGDVASATVTFVTAPTSSSGTLAIVSGDNQSAGPNGILANPLAVKVTNPQGQPVVGVPVIFSVTSGGGVISITNASTNSDGLARTTWRVGPNPGDNTVTVIARDSTGAQIAGSPQVFHALTTQ
ncbi:MAG: Ig-like domain-containing protein [Planctomycetota bacterium]